MLIRKSKDWSKEYEVILNDRSLMLYNLHNLDYSIMRKFYETRDLGEIKERVKKYRSIIKKCGKYKVYLYYEVKIPKCKHKYKTLYSLISDALMTFSIKQKDWKDDEEFNDMGLLGTSISSENFIKKHVTLEYLYLNYLAKLVIHEEVYGKTRDDKRLKLPLLSLILTMIIDGRLVK